jgi:hypothetical protein
LLYFIVILLFHQSLQDKSEGIKNMALDFKTNASAVKKQTKMGLGTKVAIGLGGLGGVGYCIWRLFFFK